MLRYGLKGDDELAIHAGLDNLIHTTLIEVDSCTYP